MKIEKLPSGNYRLRQQYHGVRYSVVVDHKPDQKEAIELMDKAMNKIRTYDLTFKEASDAYIKSREAVISPSTIAGYESIVRRLPEWFLKSKIADITQPMIQTYVNESAQIHSAKTVQNEHGFISAVLTYFYPDMRISSRLPRKRQNEAHMPSEDDIKKVIDCLGEKYQIAFRLTMYGLRRSEVCALTMDDIDGQTVTIRRAVVQDKDNNWITKDLPKTDTSFRTIFISQELADEIQLKGVVFDGNPSQLSNGVRYAVKQSGVEHFSLHKMRHFFASKASDMGITEADILKLGGWKTDFIMKSHYRHSMSHKDSSERYANQIAHILS